MTINRHTETGKQINSTKYMSEKLYEQLLTAKTEWQDGCIVSAFNPSTQGLEAGECNSVGGQPGT